MNNNNEIAIQGNNPIANIKVSTDVAGACKEIVSRSAINIGNKKYVPVEGWMAIATAHGCNLSATDVKQVDGGISARGLVRRISDGLVIGEAEGFVGDDEKTWANRALFARRAMAQTRAMSRAARSVFAHVVVLMDAGLSTTPAEEMEAVEVKEEPKKTEIKPEVKSESKPKGNTDQVITKFNQSFADAIISMQGQRLVEMTIKILELSKGFSATQWGTVLQHTKNELVKLQNQIESNLVVIDLEYKKQLAEVCKLFKYDDLEVYFIGQSFVNRIYDIVERGFNYKEFYDSKQYIPVNPDSIKDDVVKLLDHYKTKHFNENKLGYLENLSEWFGLKEHAEYYRLKRMEIKMATYHD